MSLSSACGSLDTGPTIAVPMLSLNRSRVPLGGRLEMTYRFTASPKISNVTEPYRVSVHFLDVDGQDPLTSGDRERISKDLRARLDDWRGLLRRHVPQARQILRKLLVDRVVFTPRTDHYEFVGPWTLGKLVSGVVDLPQGMASPRGILPFTMRGAVEPKVA